MNKILLALLINGLLFTFDDGPRLSTTPRILDVLKKNKVRAVFCIPSVNLLNPKKLKLVKRAVKEGHLICNHSYGHPLFNRISPAKQRWQIRHSQSLFKKYLGIKPIYFRPPGGVRTRFMLRYLKRIGMRLLMWDIDSRDWEPRTSKRWIYKKVITKWKRRRRVGKNSIVLFHDTNRKTARLLDRIIKRVKKDVK